MLLAAAGACAQELEPRLYSNTPVGINFALLGLGYMTGGVASDASQPLQNAQIDTVLPVFAYARSLDVGGRAGKFDVVVPWGCADGSADYQGRYYERDTCGAGDPSMRFSVNLYGSPALRLAEAATWRQDLIVGTSLRVTAPLGSNDPDKLLNMGSNRWAVKPEIGVSKAIGRFTLEAIGAVSLFTDNDEWFGNRKREQDPIYSLQAHLIYSLPRGTWLALNATAYRGGRTTVDGVRGDDLQENVRYGLTIAQPLTRHHSLKLVASTGAVTRTGGDFDTVSLFWQYRWGGGL